VRRQNGLDGERERGTSLAPALSRTARRSSQICPGAAGGVGGDARAWPRGSSLTRCEASLKIAGLNFSVRPGKGEAVAAAALMAPLVLLTYSAGSSITADG
jgi:hypothetical protein